MAVRRVELRITSTGFDSLNKSLDEISAKLDKLKVKLDMLSKMRISPKLEVAGLTSSDTALDKFSAKLDRIGAKRVTAHVGVNVDSGSLRRDLGKGGSQIDRLLRDATGGGKGSLVSNAVTAGAGGSSTGAGLLSALGGANNSYFGALIAALIGVGAAITPAILPFAIGGGVGLGGAVGAGALGSIGKSTITADRQMLAQAQAALAGKRGRTPSNLLALSQAQSALSKAQAKYGGFLPVGTQISNLGNTAIGDFLGALSGHGTRAVATSAHPAGGPGLQPGAQSVGDVLKMVQTPSFLQGLNGILKQVGVFLKSIGPQLGQMFRASIPFVSAFAKIMEQLAKALMPAFTQSMKALTPYLPIIIQGFKYLSLGIAQFIQNLGPGMKDSAIIFKGVMDGVKGVLDFLGTLFAGFAIEVVKMSEGVKKGFHYVLLAADYLKEHVPGVFDSLRHGVAHAWDLMWNDTLGAALHFTNHIASNITNWRHDVSNIFAGLRHDVSHWWDVTWDYIMTRLTSGYHNAISLLNTMWHNIDATFDRMRHDVSSIWDLLWRNTIGQAVSGASAVFSKFRQLATNIWNALRHLPGILWNLAKSMVENLWKGAESVAGKVTSFFSGLGHDILHAFGSIFHFGSPSKTMFHFGQMIIEGLHNGIQSKLSKVQGLMGGFNSKLVGNAGAGVQRWAGTVLQALRMEGLSASLLPRVLYQMQTESGGNPNAINLTDSNAAAGDPSRGLLQTIGSTFSAYHWPGTSSNIYDPLANIAAAINYARHRYGPSLMSGGMGMGSGHGYAGGGWIREPVLGFGMRSGSPYTFGEKGSEYVTPHGGGGDIYITVQGDTNPDAAALRISTLLQGYAHRHGGAQPWNR